MWKRISDLFDRSASFRFFVTGVFNTAASFCTFSILVLFELHFVLANLVSLIIGIGISYLTSGKIVFRYLSWNSFLRFVVMWAAIYLLQISIIGLTVRLIDEAMIWGFPTIIIGGFLALCIAVPMSFVIQRHFVFRSGGSPGQ